MDLRRIAFNIVLTNIAIRIAGRKEEILKKYPKYEKDVEYFISRDPSHSLKYIDWQMKILQSKQALAREIADVTDLFHKHGRQLEKKDINQYEPTDFTELRDKLFEIRDKQGKRKEKVEERYKLSDKCDYEEVYDSEKFRVIQVKNKEAAAHYGLGTKWCISMKDAAYFDDYDMNNVVFFFILTKNINQTLSPEEQNSLYKIAISIQRDENNEPNEIEYYDAKDNDIEESTVEKYTGRDFSGIMPKIKSITKSYPKSPLTRMTSGELDDNEVLKVFREMNFATTEGLFMEGRKEFYDVYGHLMPQLTDIIDHDVLYQIIYDPDTPVEALVKLAKNEDSSIRSGVAGNTSTPPEVLAELAKDKDAVVKRFVAGNTSTPSEVLAELSKDEDVRDLFDSPFFAKQKMQII